MISKPSDARTPLGPLLDDGAALFRLVAALTADELGRQRNRPIPPSEWRQWRADTRLDEDGMGADSLMRLEIATRLDGVLHLHDSGVEDYLTLAPTLGEWTEIAAAGLRLCGNRISFQTSGATGAPKRVAHAASDLRAEVDGHAGVLGAWDRVVALVPPHHIYGFLFTVLGPSTAGAPVFDARGITPGAIAATARAGDLVIATPFLWDLVARSGARFPPGVQGVVSTAPCPAATWSLVTETGLGRLVEIYGSTETAGLGWRDAPGSDFTVLPHVEADPAQGRFLRRRDGAPIPAPDRLAWRHDGRFLPQGRVDGAVQVGGVNVFPERVRAVLLELDGIADCAVRPTGADASARLKAFVVPASPCARRGLETRLAGHCAARLTPPERPVRVDFGPELPRNEIGKPADW